MEEENNKRETRGRSRSKTPLTLRSSVDRDVEVDGEKKKTKKNPTVEWVYSIETFFFTTPFPFLGFRFRWMFIIPII